MNVVLLNWIIIAILLTFALGELIYILLIKGSLREIAREMARTRESSYDRQIQIRLSDPDLEKATTEINRNLDFQKSLKSEAEKSEREMKQSVSDIAHDLRTPLTVVKGNLQMLGNEEGLSPDSKSYLRICQEKTDLLKDMVDNFFELSVLESDSQTLELSKIDVKETLIRFILDHETVIRQNNLEPELNLPEEAIFLMGDERLLLRMFSNLLNNILKYAKDSFSVELKVNPDEKVEILFANELCQGRNMGGDGLSVDHLFDRAYRGDTARQTSGAGLGLYIVKLLAEKQGGSVYAQISENQLEFHILLNRLDLSEK